jgi:hypothetical protein
MYQMDSPAHMMPVRGLWAEVVEPPPLNATVAEPVSRAAGLGVTAIVRRKAAGSRTRSLVTLPVGDASLTVGVPSHRPHREQKLKWSALEWEHCRQVRIGGGEFTLSVVPI